ncbi:MAG TPA: hypothetical protein VF771_15545 [Longimicrobiaceae bacterium]
MNAIRLHILERELESTCLMALEAAEEFEARAETGADADAAVLAQAAVHLALKASFLIWRGGRRLSDRYAAQEAEHLQDRLELTESSPLAHAQMQPLAELLTLSNGELLRAVDPAMMTVTLHGVTRSLRPMVAALSRVAAALGATAEPRIGGGAAVA